VLNVTSGIVFANTPQLAADLTTVINVSSGASLYLDGSFSGVPASQAINLNGTGDGGEYAALTVASNVDVTGSITLLGDTLITHSWNYGNIYSTITGTNTNLELRNLRGGQPEFNILGAINIGTGGLTTSIANGSDQYHNLFGNSTYTGATTVSSGVLYVSGSLGATNVTVNSGARFGGIGAIGGNLNLLDGSLFQVQNINDALLVSGQTTLFAGFGVDDLAGLDLNSTANGIYTLIDGDLATGVFAGLANNSQATAFAFGVDRSAYFQNGSLQLVVIPEPNVSALLGSLGVLALLRRRR
jgi:hypothetical protein